MIRALGWTTVLAPKGEKKELFCQVSSYFGGHNRRIQMELVSPIVTSPLISLSTHTTAPAAILALEE